MSDKSEILSALKLIAAELGYEVTGHGERADRQYLTPDDVAKRMRVSREKVGKWIREGELPALNVSQSRLPRFRIRPEDLEVFERRKMVVPTVRTVVARRLNRPAVEYV